jgi:DNA-directed RNA polymerase subunit RPC12/RpoP
MTKLKTCTCGKENDMYVEVPTNYKCSVCDYDGRPTFIDRPHEHVIECPRCGHSVTTIKDSYATTETTPLVYSFCKEKNVTEY